MQKMSWLWSSKAKKKPVSTSDNLESNLFVQSDIHDIVNPLTWDNLPEIVRKSCPKWKDEELSRSYSEGIDSPRPSDGDGDDIASFKTESPVPFSPSAIVKAPPVNSIEYMVCPGDTLSSIASKFDMTPSEVILLNKLGFQTVVLPNQVLYVHGPEGPNPRLGSTKSNEGMWSGTLDPPPSSPAQTFPVEASEVENSKHIPKGTGSPDVFASSDSEVDVSYSTFKDEINVSHLKIKGKHLTKEQGCVKGFLLLTSHSLVFTPYQYDALVIEKTSAPFEIVIFMEDIIYAAVVSHFELTDVPIPTSPYWLEMEERLSLLQPPHPLPGRPVRESVSEPQQKKTQTLHEEGHGRFGTERNITDEESSNQWYTSPNPAGGDGLSLHKSNKMRNSDVQLCGDPFEEGQVGGPLEEGQVVGPLEEGQVGGPLEEGQVGGPLEEGQVGGPLEEGQVGGPLEEGQVGDPLEEGQVSGPLEEGQVGGSLEEACLDYPFCDVNSTASNSRSLSFDPNLSIEYVDTRSCELPPGAILLSQDEQAHAKALGLGLPKYLRVKVSSDPHHTFTSSPTGVDIPGKKNKDEFCFAISSKNVEHVITFFVQNHPKVNIGSVQKWEDGSFVMIDVDRDNALSVNSNHFSDPWEVLSFSDIYRPVIAKMVTNDLPLPSLSEESKLLSLDLLQKLSNNLIALAVGLSWILGYSTFRDGFSIKTLYRKLMEFEDCPCVLVIKDKANTVFGAMLPCSLKRSDRFYGTGESYLFRHTQEVEFQMYNWTGRNEFFVKGDKDCLMIGGGDGRCGIWIDENLLHGSSSYCDTFANEILSSDPEFVIVGLEAWMLS